MNEFKLLTAGLILNRGNKTKHLRFCEKTDIKNGGINDDASKIFNFFGERHINKEISESTPLPSFSSSTKLKSNTAFSNSNTESNISNDSSIKEWYHSEEEINQYRKKNRIYIHYNSSNKSLSANSNSIPAPIREFKDLIHHYNVDGWLVDSILNNFKFKSPTPIQSQAIPCILKGQPLLASAPTGSGKTIAFIVPLLFLMKSPSKKFLRSLIIVPSRELGGQIVREFDVLASHKHFRCRLLERQTTTSTTPRRLDCGVCTPLKLVQLLRDNDISFGDLRYLVLDEADRLLDLGFSAQLDEILSYVDLKTVQLLFFSATLATDVVSLAESVVFNPTHISIGTPMAAASDIQQKLIFVTNEEGKMCALKNLVNDGEIQPPTLIFVQTIERAKQLFTELVFDGLYVDVIHADRSKKERDNIIRGFRERKIWILICTDLMARGVDFKGVRVVINWDLPQSAAAYIHRIGRTGRAGKQGNAFTLFTLHDIPYLRSIIGVMRQSGCNVPEWMLKLKKPAKKKLKHFVRSGIHRKPIQTNLPAQKQDKKKVLGNRRIKKIKPIKSSIDTKISS